MASKSRSVPAYETREQWLEAAVEVVRPWFEEVGAPLPERVRVSCGWPSKGARSRAIGECWSPECSAAGVHEIFVSPKLDDLCEVLAVLVHECVHAAVGLECGHKGAFKRTATALGLEGKMTATTAGPVLLERMQAVIAKCGDYPHLKLEPGETSGPKKQGTRLLKVECDSCGYTVRTTAKWLDVGVPVCPCGTPMTPPDDWQDADAED